MKKFYKCTSSAKENELSKFHSALSFRNKAVYTVSSKMKSAV